MPGLTLTDILEERRSLHDKGVVLIESSAREDFLSYNELYESAARVLSALQERGLGPADELVFQVTDNKTFLIIFWACILGGIIPVPLTVGQNDEHKKKLFNIWSALKYPWLVCAADTLSRIATFAAANGLDPVMDNISTRTLLEEDLKKSSTQGHIFSAQPDDVAFIQFSSGSTSSPKGVMLTHRNLITNIGDISNAAGYTADDSMLSWMPLTHDMGLIGFHLNPLFMGMQHYIMPTQLYVRTPVLWIDKVVQHRVAVLCSPNFGYSYFIRHCGNSEVTKWDLSAVRILYNGAEPVMAATCQEFMDFLAPAGLRASAMTPVYGLAEGSLAVSMSSTTQLFTQLNISRDHLKRGGQVKLSEDTHAVPVVCVGLPVENCFLRICVNDNVTTEEGVIGDIEIKGPAVTQGYYNNENANKATFTPDGWLRTGDVGFLSEKQLYVTGRAKDIIFINGQNYYAHDIEGIAQQVPGIELNKVVAAGYFDHAEQAEKMLLFVFHRGSTESFQETAKAVRALIGARLGIETGHVIPVRDIPRTTSGKLQRFKLLERFNNGEYDELIAKIRDIDVVTPDLQSENETESILLDIWKKLLKQQHISIDVPFFDIGGNSLKAAEMASHVATAFQVELPVEMIYENLSIRKLAEKIQHLHTSSSGKIPPAGNRPEYPLSDPQKGIYYSWMTAPDSVAYNIPVALKIAGELDIQRLKDAVRKIVRRHSSLRAFFTAGKEPAMRISDHVPFTLSAEHCQVEDIDNTLRSFVLPFNLFEAPLFRIKLLHAASGAYFLFLDFHHIIADGKSVYNFLEELWTLYQGDEPEALSVQYEDYAVWSNLQQDNDDLQYWQQYLQEGWSPLQLQGDFRRPAVATGRGGKIPFTLEEETTAALRKLATDNNCTLHVVLFTLYNVLLARYTRQQKIPVGIPVAGRWHKDLQPLTGMFVNNLPLVTDIDWNESFTGLLLKQKQHMLEVLQHQRCSFQQMTSLWKQQGSNAPLFHTMFVYQNMEFPLCRELAVTTHFFDPGFSKYDLSLEIFDEGACLHSAFEYSADLFRQETAASFVTHFETLIQSVITDPTQSISRLPILTAAQWNKYIRDYNNTTQQYPADKKIHELFEHQVYHHPEKIAVEYKDTRLTYEALNRMADDLAVRIKRTGADGVVVGILLKRSPALIAAILGVLKAGCAFLPIDPALPDDRITALLSHSQCRLLITDFTQDVNIQVIDPLHPATDPVTIDYGSKALTDVAYVMYTSGTTGHPKGVVVGHPSLVNYICWTAANYLPEEDLAMPLFTSVSFDLTITSIFTPLITGNRIVIYEENSSELMLELVLQDNKVDVVKLTPSHLRLLREMKSGHLAQSRIRRFIIGGESLDQQLVQDISRKFTNQPECFNEYGPTEATVGCMICKFSDDQDTMTVPIGVPAANTQIYLLDDHLEPVPEGISGEIYIAGDCLAKGYLYDEHLSSIKFIPNPFIEGTRMYKTGDVARRLSNNELEYQGRADNQIKLNGYRIEPAEIEELLRKYPGLSDALVVLRSPQRRLLAYYTGSCQSEELRSYLSAKLPYYMVPAQFIPVEAFPLTRNGKIDFALLPDAYNEAVAVHSGNYNHIEQTLFSAWEDILGLSVVNYQDNFYNLGGDSIKAVQIVSRLSEKGIVLRVSDILTYQTIEQISKYVQLSGPSVYEQGAVTGEKQPTPAEAWFLNWSFSNPHFYNQSVLLKLNRPLKTALLEKAFRLLIQHHDGLRMNIDPERSVLFFNEPDIATEFIIESLPDLLSCQALKGQLDIYNGVPLKAALVNDKEAFLFITAHHLLTDGFSWRILLKDLLAVYQALERNEAVTLPAKTASLPAWQQQVYKHAEKIQEQEAYWKQVTEESFSLPQDFETDDWQVANEMRIVNVLEESTTLFLLKNAHKPYNTDTLILLGTALGMALRLWTGSSRSVVELENHGRTLEGVDVSETVGWFTAMYPVLLHLPDTDNIGTHIKAIKEQIRSVPDMGIGYGLLKYKGPVAAEERTALRFNYLGQFGKEFNNELFSYQHGSTGPDSDPRNALTTKLEIIAMVVNDRLHVEARYNSKAFLQSTIKGFMNSFMEQLQLILLHTDNEKDLHFTPSDFDAVDLNDEELDALFY